MAIVGCDYKIDTAFPVDCSVNYANGIKAKAVLINKSDVASYAFAEGTKYNEVTALTLVNSAKGYTLHDVRKVPFDGSTTALGDSGTKATTAKTVQFLYHAKGAEAARQIDAVKNGKFVIVFQTEDSDRNGTDGGFEVIGLLSALTCSACERTLAGDTNDNCYLVTMTCNEPMDGVYLAETNADTIFAGLTTV